MRKKILDLLDQHTVMTLATLRPDGWPQATTVGYTHHDMTLYFVCDRESQKAANLAKNDRVSLTIDHDTPDILAIAGLSMAAHASAVGDPAEAKEVLTEMEQKWAGQNLPDTSMPSLDAVQVFRVTPAFISVLDYAKGFGHTDLVTF